MNAITVIVPVYNTQRYLDRCITSIINQTFQDIEILLINDGSTDTSLEVLLKYANKDARIKMINQKNRGLSATRNIGIRLARGIYILHVDSDDWIEPDMCEILYKEAKQYNADIVTSHVYFDYPNKSLLKREPYKKVNDFNEYLLKFATTKGINSIWNKLIKRDLYIVNNIEHYENISLGEDSSALLRLIIFAHTIVSVNKYLYHYNINISSMTGNKEKKCTEYIHALSEVESFYRKNNLKTNIFPLLKLKIAYITLYGNLRLSTAEYEKLKKHFYDDIKPIITHAYFWKIPVSYKIFVFMGLLLKFIEGMGIKKK